MLAWLTWLLKKKREKKEPSSSKLIILPGIWNGLHCSFHVSGNPEYAFKISFESKSNVINVQRSSEIAARGEIMRQSLEGLSTAIERFINLLEVRGARAGASPSLPIVSSRAHAPTQKSIISYRLDKSVGQQLSGFSVCTPRRELPVCLQVNPGVRVRIQIFGEISSKEKFESCSADTRIMHDLLPPPCHVAHGTELKPFTQ